MPESSAFAAMAREYGAQFAAGFLASAIAMTAIYTAVQTPVRPAATTHPDVINRLSFAGSASGHPSQLMPNTTVIAGSQRLSELALGRALQRQTASHRLQAAAYEIAGRFSGISPVVDPIITPAVSEPAISEPAEAVPVALPSKQDAPRNVPLAMIRPIQQDTSRPPAAPKPSIRLETMRNGTSTTRLAFPLDLNPSWAGKPDAGLLIAGLPEGVILSAGRRTALGLWKLSSADARTVQIMVGPTSPAQFDLTVLLLDADGLVVNGIDAVVAMRDAEPGMTAKKITGSAAVTPKRTIGRRSAGNVSTRRHKSSQVRQTGHKTKRSPSWQTATLLKSDVSPATSDTLLQNE